MLFADSADLMRPSGRWGAALVAWIWSQHKEHRIVGQRLSSLLGEAVLNLPPGAGGVPATVLLLLAISGSLACWLVCTPLAWHPQPWENII